MELAWFVGVDWGSQTHQACVSDVAGKLLGERAFEHGGQGLSEMADWILSFTAGKAEQVGVAIETPRGPVVESLMERGFAVHAINPKQLDRFRDRISPAGAKDDRRDARVLASALRTDPHCLRRLEPTDPAIVELREWSRLSEEITRERVRQANRMREQLWRYYPQLLAATSDDVAASWALALWRRLPTPVAAQRVREATLAKLLKQHRIRRVDAATLCDRLRAPAVRVAPGAAEAAAAHVRLIAERLVLVNRQLAHARSQLDRLVHQLAEAAPAEDPDAPAESEPEPSPPPPDAAILLALPGIGTGVLACLLAEGSDALRRRDYAALRCLCGVAPVTRRSGKSLLVVRRLAAHDRLRNAAYHWLASLPTETRSAAPSIRRCAAAAMDTPAPCAQWPTACSTSPAPCSATAPASTRTVQEMSPRELVTHALDRHSPRLGESDDETARGRCGHVVCGVSTARWARLCVHGAGSVHAPSRHLTPISTAVTTTQKDTCKMVGSPFLVAISMLDGGGRCAAADEFGGQPAAAGVRRDVGEAGQFSEGLEAPVDLASAERDDALAVGRLNGLAQRVDGRRESSHQQPVVLARALGVGLRGADAHPQQPGPLGGCHVLPAQRGDLRAAQTRAEGERDDRAVREAARGGRAGRFDPAGGPPGLGRERQEHDGAFEREWRGLARRGVRARGVLAGDAGDDGAHAGGGRWVVGPAGAVRGPDGGCGHADGRRPGRLGALGQVGGDEDGRGRQGLGRAGAAPGFEPGPLAGVGAPRAWGAGVGRRRGDARLLAGRDARGRLAGGGEGVVGHGLLCPISAISGQQQGLHNLRLALTRPMYTGG